MTAALTRFMSDYSVVIELPVQWGEMDALGHVNNIVYLRWFESARMEYLSQTGFMDRLASESLGPILASTEVRYRLPVEFPDTVKIGCRASDIGADQMMQHYGVFSFKKNGLVTSGKSRIVMYDFNTSRKTNIPADIVENMVHLEKQRSD